jgi:hypothetical protein
VPRCPYARHADRIRPPSRTNVMISDFGTSAIFGEPDIPRFGNTTTVRTAQCGRSRRRLMDARRCTTRRPSSLSTTRATSTSTATRKSRTSGAASRS